MAEIVALRALVRSHTLEWERAHRRAHRFRRLRSAAHLVALDRLADDAQRALSEAEVRYWLALEAFSSDNESGGLD